MAQFNRTLVEARVIMIFRQNDGELYSREPVFIGERIIERVNSVISGYANTAWLRRSNLEIVSVVTTYNVTTYKYS